jgi:hypothetical protein
MTRKDLLLTGLVQNVKLFIQLVCGQIINLNGLIYRICIVEDKQELTGIFTAGELPRHSFFDFRFLIFSGFALEELNHL